MQYQVKWWKLALTFIVMLITNLSIAGVGGGPILPPAAPNTPYLLDPDPELWNWTDELAFADVINADGDRGLTSPWAYDDHFGLNMTGNMPLQSQGWRLVTRKFTCEDFNGSTVCEDPSRLTRNWPHFVLYNYYTGIFRVFIYVDTEQTDGANLIHTLVSVTDNTGKSAPVKWFANELDLSIPLSQAVDSDNLDLKTQAPLRKGDWFVMDIPFGYDPSLPQDPDTVNNDAWVKIPLIPDNLSVRLDMYAVKWEEIDLSGEMVFMKDGRPIGGGKGVSTSKKPNLIDAFGTAKGKYNEMRSSVDEAVSWLNSSSQDILNDDSSSDFKTDVGVLLNSVAQDLPALSGGISYTVAGAALVNALSDRGNKGATSIQFDSASIDMNGTIYSEAPLHTISFGIPGSKHYKDIDKQTINELTSTNTDGYRGHLGLFSLKEVPKINSYNFFAATSAVQYFTLQKDFWSLLNINRTSPLTLVDAKYSMVLKTNGYHAFDMSWERSHIKPEEKLYCSDFVEWVESAQGILPHNDVADQSVSFRSKFNNGVDTNASFKYLISSAMGKSHVGDHHMNPGVAGLPPSWDDWNYEPTLMCIPHYVLEYDPKYEAYLKLQLKFKDIATDEYFTFIRTYPAEVVDHGLISW